MTMLDSVVNAYRVIKRTASQAFGSQTDVGRPGHPPTDYGSEPDLSLLPDDDDDDLVVHQEAKRHKPLEARASQLASDYGDELEIDSDCEQGKQIQNPSPLLRNSDSLPLST